MKGPIMRLGSHITVKRRKKEEKGFSLPDTMVAVLVLMIIVTGSLSYRYVSAANIEKSQQHLTAMDLAVTFLETWQGVSGASTFDPEIVFAGNLPLDDGSGENQPSGYTLLGKYEVTDDNDTYQLTLSWNDVGSSLRALNVIVAWTPGKETDTKTYQLTTYAVQ